MTENTDTAPDLRTYLRRLIDAQEEHPAYAAIGIDWDQPVDALGCTAIIGEERRRVTMEELIGLTEARRKLIQREKDDPLRFGYEPPFWGKVDLMVARMRRKHPGVQLELLLMGGIRSGKTEFATKRIVQHFFYTPHAWCWGLHEVETSSKRIQQRRVHRFIPSELQTATGKHKKDKHTQFSYSEGNGFTGNAFTLGWRCRDWKGREIEGGGMFDFKFYGAAESTLQGSELTMATSDELIPKSTCDTVRERLLSRAADTRKPQYLEAVDAAIRILEAGDVLPPALIAVVYHSVHVISFTPKEGYSATVADFLDGANTIAEVPAELLPPRNGQPQMVPRFKQPRKATRLVAYFHTYDNVFGGNWPAMVEQMREAKEDYIRIVAYGDVSKGWAGTYPKFKDTVHVVPRESIPRVGTWYEICDPAGSRNWFMIWALVDPQDRLFIVREWPQEGDWIDGVGDPGPWAVSSEKGLRNGDPGSAQESFGWGFERYAKEIRRVREEIGAWWGAKDGTPGPAIEPALSLMDSRLGQAETVSHGASTTILECLNEQPGMDWHPAPGDRLREGDQQINDRLDYDDTRPVDPLNRPSLQIADNCRAVLFMFQNYGVPTKSKDEACKDPRDCIAYLVNANPVHLSSVRMQTRGGGCY